MTSTTHVLRLPQRPLLAVVLASTAAIGATILAATAVEAAQPARGSGANTAAKPSSRSVARPIPFSRGPVGATAPAGWSVQPLPKVERKTVYDLIDDSGSIVLRARANRSAASLRHSVYADPARTPILRWRWRTDHVLQAGDMTTKEGDDYAARVYVFFDRDPETMSLKDRTLLKVGRARYGNDLPAAALCYVWDNRQPVGTIRPNAYTPFVAMVVASSGTGEVGRWVSLRRNIAEDYRRAFGTAAPQITGVAVSVDTDNTGESAVSYFGDIEFVASDTK
jgi:Protein of unknown function (DUF3047)